VPGVTLTDELADVLLPFTLMFDLDGQVVSASSFVRSVWQLGESGPEALRPIEERLVLQRPFSAPFTASWLPELTGVIVHICLRGLEGRTIRGQFHEHGAGWLFSGFPQVNSVASLEKIGMQISDLPLHTAVGDMLIANEASLASLRDAQTKADLLKKANDRLKALNERFSRFVPQAMLEAIGVSTPLDAKLGQHVESRMAVMFADLRQFTTISEALGTDRTFDVINEYLQASVPCIEAHEGYVVQYLGDGIMALFPGANHAALRAAIGMQESLKRRAATIEGLPIPLRMSIGIHEGSVSLGIVGNESRWDASIIADAVNTSARIESMTRVLGGEILVSRKFLESHEGGAEFAQRDLGRHEIRGRQGSVELVEILESLEPSVRETRALSQDDFAAGLHAYRSGDLYVAMSCFSRVLSKVPDDLAAQFYLARVSQRLQAIPT